MTSGMDAFPVIFPAGYLYRIMSEDRKDIRQAEQSDVRLGISLAKLPYRPAGHNRVSQPVRRTNDYVWHGLLKTGDYSGMMIRKTLLDAPNWDC